MSIEKGVYSPPESVEQFEQEYTGFEPPVYSLPPQTGWEEVETFKPIAFGPYVPTPEIQPLQTPQKEIITQTNVTEVTQIVETIYQEAEFDPLPPMEFQAGVPETYGTLGYFGILLSIMTLGLVPMPEEML